MKESAGEHRATVLRLASLRGVQPAYTDAFGVRRRATVESMARALAALGSPASTGAEAAASLRSLMEALRERRLEPVTVAWSERAASARLRFPTGPVRGRVAWTVELEAGGALSGSVEAGALALRRPPAAEAWRGVEVVVPLPRGLPLGYHRLTLSHGGRAHRSLLVCAPRKSYAGEGGEGLRGWGVFSPVYALRSGSNLGCGNLTDLRGLASWARGLGGGVVATLPLLPSFLGEAPGPADPSPYAPVSRLFWNELYLDPARSPEMAECPEARRLMGSAAFRRRAAALRRGDLVDYAASAALQRRVLSLLADRFFARGGEGSPSFRRFLEERPEARGYALFRAVTERQGAPWSEWPARLRGGRLQAGDADPGAVRHHLYAQHLAWMEMLSLSSELHAEGGVLYLDLPVGASPHGFDAYRWRGLFASGCSTGAPPDPYFTGGQDWGFPPLHPEACREEGYGYVIAMLRHHMRHAQYLRLDHVMAFHRLFWIAEGATPAEGVYVRYPDEELYALLCLESVRNRCRLVGENLGTVPPAVNRALASHGLCGLFVAQYEMQPRRPALRTPPAACVASVNTHDMPPLATSLSGADIDDRIALGMLEKGARAREHAARRRMRGALEALLRSRGLLPKGRATAAGLRDGLHAFLASSGAEFVLVNLEDLWLETSWQNVPGTMREHPNWRRRHRLTLEEIRASEPLARLLRRIDALRRGGGAAGGGAARVRRRAAGARA